MDIPKNFISFAFAAFVALEAIYFTIFGFFYSLFSGAALQSKVGLPPISKDARDFCRRIAYLITFNALCIVYALFLDFGIINPPTSGQESNIYVYLLALFLLISILWVPLLAWQIYLHIRREN